MGGEMPAVPITVRQLEAIVRISESLARMQLQPTATEAHVREAIDLFKTSTMDAVKSGAPRTLGLRAQFRCRAWEHLMSSLLRALPFVHGKGIIRSKGQVQTTKP